MNSSLGEMKVTRDNDEGLLNQERRKEAEEMITYNNIVLVWHLHKASLHSNKLLGGASIVCPNRYRSYQVR